LPDTPTVLLAINDLIFESKVRTTAAANGIGIVTVRSVPGMAKPLESGSIRLVIVDLNTVTDAVDAIRNALERAPDARIVAYVSHVDADLARSARDAGAHAVLPRSRFVTELPAILLESTL